MADKNEKDLANKLLTEMSEDQVSTKPASCASWSPKSVNGINYSCTFSPYILKFTNIILILFFINHFWKLLKAILFVLFYLKDKYIEILVVDINDQQYSTCVYVCIPFNLGRCKVQEWDPNISAVHLVMTSYLGAPFSKHYGVLGL